MPEKQPAKQPAKPTPQSDKGPLWARAARLFYASSYDVRSKKAMSEAMAEFMEMEDGEQRFHVAHLLFRQIQAMEDVHSTLLRIEKRMALSEKDRVTAMKSLGRIRDAVEDLAEGEELGEQDELSLEDVILDDPSPRRAGPQGSAESAAPPEEHVELLIDGQVVEVEGA